VVAKGRLQEAQEGALGGAAPRADKARSSSRLVLDQTWPRRFSPCPRCSREKIGRRPWRSTEDGVNHLARAVRSRRTRVHEPPDFGIPGAEALGAVLLAAGRAHEAETVYWEDLKAQPRERLVVYGLAKHSAPGKSEQASIVELGLRKRGPGRRHADGHHAWSSEGQASRPMRPRSDRRQPISPHAATTGVEPGESARRA